MKASRIASIAVLAASLFASSAAHAAEFSLGGYYRMRLLLFNSLSAGVGLGGVPEDATTGYWQQRVRLDPKIKLNDNVAFFTQIDLLDNVIAGDYPEVSSSFGNTLPEFLSQAVVPQHEVDAAGNVVGDTRRNIAVKRAWAEVLTGVGQLKFGRMGSHWGLGILANDGNGWDDDFGDTVDRIMFITKVGPIYFVPMVSKIAEGSIISATGNRAVDPGSSTLHVGADDVDEYILVAVYRGELSSAGIYGVYRIQPSTDTRIMVADGWGKTRIGPVAVEAEAVYLTGRARNFIPPNSPVTLDVAQWAVAVETELPLKRITPGLDFGAASGDDAAGPTDGDLNAFTFDRNYRIAFLMFRYVNVLGAPPAISNATYVRPNVQFELFPNFVLDAAVVYAQTLSDSPTYEQGPYGTELDLGATWRLYEDFEAGVRYGLLVPGAALKPPTATQSLDPMIHGVEGRFLVRF